MNMQRKLKPIVFYSFFNPVHQGHIELANKEFERTGRPILFTPLPASCSQVPCPSDDERLAMLRIALKGQNPAFEIDTETMKRDGFDLYMDGYLGFPANRKPLMPSGDVGDEDPLHACLPFESVRVKQERPMQEGVRSFASFLENEEERAYIEEKRLYCVGHLARLLKSEHRLQHSLSVAHLAYEIALSNHYMAPGLAYLAGLLHDCGKHCDRKKELEVMKEAFPGLTEIYPEWAWHQFVGSYMVEAEFGIHNGFVQEAIRYHATGRKRMSPLAKIIYAADKIEPLRGYDSSSMIEECKKDYEKGFLTVLSANRDYLTEKGYKVDNPSTKECFDFYLGDK